jgi:hypothetical protein
MTDISLLTLSDATTVGTGNAATDGTGNFDKLMKVVTLHVEKQFTDGRITGTDYATVYLGALQSTLAQAVSFTLNMNKANKEADLLAQKEITEFAQTGKTSSILPDAASVTGKQITLFTEQAKGFKWNADAKYLKSLLDAYAINVSVSKVSDTATLKLKGGTANTGIDSIISTYAPTG